MNKPKKKRAARLAKICEMPKAKTIDATERMTIENLGLNAEGRPQFRIASGPNAGKILVYQGENESGEIMLVEEPL